jgi:flavin reductase (DIM6/NTAB) family NADH-FMN oxidoreductase RutF
MAVRAGRLNPELADWSAPRHTGRRKLRENEEVAGARRIRRVRDRGAREESAELRMRIAMPRRVLPLGSVYRLLEPGPVVLVTTAHQGRANIMTMSWHTMMEFEPPLVGCVISGRHLTFDLLRASKECVIAIPTVEIAKQVVACGNHPGRRVDKFRKTGLTPAPASLVKAPLVEECFANLECRVLDARLVPRYNFFVLQVLKAWIDPARKHPRTLHHMGRGLFMVAGKTMRLKSKAK